MRRTFGGWPSSHYPCSPSTIREAGEWGGGDKRNIPPLQSTSFAFGSFHTLWAPWILSPSTYLGSFLYFLSGVRQHTHTAQHTKDKERIFRQSFLTSSPPTSQLRVYSSSLVLFFFGPVGQHNQNGWPPPLKKKKKKQEEKTKNKNKKQKEKFKFENKNKLTKQSARSQCQKKSCCFVVLYGGNSFVCYLTMNVFVFLSSCCWRGTVKYIATRLRNTEKVWGLNDEQIVVEVAVEVVEW